MEMFLISINPKLVQLPRFYISIGNAENERISVIIDSGAEDNIIREEYCLKNNIIWTEILIQSKGYNNISQTFKGETITTVWLRGISHLVSFYVMQKGIVPYNIFLGMPFILDTKLT